VGSAATPFLAEAELKQILGTAHSRGPRPNLVSLRDTNVGDLTVSGLDLSACRFSGAINLDWLRLESSRFARSPRAFQLADRQVIAEERDWRAVHDRRARDWAAPAQPHGRPHEDLEPGEVAPIYRALRKGREDLKDEPGAADFYYGEMEMRRHGASSRTERSVLSVLWLVSGYGLRTSRALAALLVTVVAFAVVFEAWGFDQHQSLGTALLFSLESTTSLLRGADRDLTEVGETLWIVLRLLGPAFFGLAILSLRGRIKR
jgi:hypothetical protein